MEQNAAFQAELEYATAMVQMLLEVEVRLGL